MHVHIDNRVAIGTQFHAKGCHCHRSEITPLITDVVGGLRANQKFHIFPLTSPVKSVLGFN